MKNSVERSVQLLRKLGDNCCVLATLKFSSRGPLASCFQFQFLVRIPHVKASIVTSIGGGGKLLQMRKARPSPWVTAEPSLNPAACRRFTQNEGLPHGQDLFLLSEGFCGQWVCASCFKYGYGSPLAGIIASPELLSQSHSWCNGRDCRVWRLFPAEPLPVLVFSGGVGWGELCMLWKAGLPSLRWACGVAAAASEMRLLGGLAWEPGTAGGMLPPALAQAQPFSDAALQSLSVSTKGLTILVQKKTQPSSEKCCSTPKLGHPLEEIKANWKY